MSTYERLVNSQNFFSPYLTQEDLSRLGRNYLNTGELIEIVFPVYEVRYIAINDGVDSLKGDDDFTPFRNIMNEFYARDTSRKIRSVLVLSEEPGKVTEYFPEYFDKILIDAPCSGEGMFRKDKKIDRKSVV